MFTWLRDLLGSPPRYSLLQTLHQPLPEPSMETPPLFSALAHQPALICWPRGPTTNAAGTGCGQAPYPGEKPTPGQTRWTPAQGQLGNPGDTGDSLPDPQGPQPGHTQLAWTARDRGTQLPRT